MNKIIGALWKREKDGKEYLSGVISDFRGDINIAVFPNTYKNQDNHPDFNIVISFGADKKPPPEEAKPTVTTPKKNGKKKEEDTVPF